ncbi:MAG TPA: gephyrin-like molybdotransferase Glp [Vicinamibacterales bacterium]|nr:gephyrin-like molybdotransferase Glp [Vicinamibacterales bacterium]
MRPITSTLTFHDALRLILDAARPTTRTESVGLLSADGRVVARNVVAEADVPAFDRAAMDGYAVVAADTAGATAAAPRTLACVDQVFSGHVPSRGIGPGECSEIATGAPMPDGADAVVMVEDTSRDGARVSVRAPVVARQNVGRRAADLAAGATVVSSGQIINPSRIGALAATGVTHVDVFAQPTVALLSTGDEIVPPGARLAPGQIHDINRYTLASVIARHGGRAVMLPSVPDMIDALVEALDAAGTHDIVVFSGGSSVGERDLVLDVLSSRGQVVFRGIAVKPGKPTIFGWLGSTAVFGLPGYPASCLSNAYMLLVPFLRKTARLPEWEPRSLELPLARRIVSPAGRHQFYTVRVVDGAAEPAFKASGDITSMANADGYIEIGADTEAVEAGTVVRVRLF